MPAKLIYYKITVNGEKKGYMDMLNDNVGKKIVEALKMQNNQVQTDNVPSENVYTAGIEGVLANNSVEEVEQTQEKDVSADFLKSDFNTSQISVDNAFAQSLAQNLGTNVYADSAQGIDLPANVTILNNLISKLPVGVSKQTGALIIKQTMEALGIPMSSVLQEAKQVQDSLSASALECQKNIIEYKKQIGMLEQKAQSFQKQAVAMNDIIALFAKTN